MAEGKDKFDINNDQKLKQDNLDKSDGPIAKTEILKGHEGHDHEHDPIAKTEILDGQPEHGNQSHVSEPTADGVIFPGNDEWDQPGLVSDGSIAKTEILDGQPEHGIHDTETRADADFSPTPIYDTEDRADADFRPGNENFDINNDQKIAFDKSDGPGPDGVSGEVVNMADMHSHMDDAAEHQAPEGPPQNPQGMGLDRLGTQFDEDGMGDMHKPDDPNDGGEVV